MKNVRSGQSVWGSLVYWTLSSSRQMAHQHLQKAFGQTLSSKQIQQIAHEVFQNLVFNFFECLRFDRMDDQQFFGKIETKGWEHMKAVHRAGHGGIFVTGHIGNWELSAAYAAKQGIPLMWSHGGSILSL